ncbi:unnamed protein product [Caenorhabditis brenneri]
MVFLLLFLPILIQGCLVVKENLPTTPLPTTPVPITKCRCPVELVDSTNAAEYISHYPIYYKSLIKYSLAMPIPTVSPGTELGDCVLVSTCPSGYTRIVITQGGSHELQDPHLFCMNRRWTVPKSQENSYVTNYVFLTCVDYNSPTPAPTPRSCNCADPTLLSTVGDPSYQLVNWKINAVMIEETDPCFILLHCRDEAIMQLWINGEYYTEELSTGMCHYQTNNWEIPAPQIWIPTKSFNFSCIEPIPFWQSCGCQAELLDTTRAQKFIGNQEFYLGNLSRYDLVKPSAAMVQDCMLQFDCPGDMSRVMIADNEWHVIDTMEGFCKARRWDIKIGSKTIASETIYMTCVNFNILAPTTTTREPPISSAPVRVDECGCRWDLLDASNASYYLSRYEIYTTTLFKYDLVLPEPEVGQCGATWKCPGDLKIVIFDDTKGYEALNPTSWCDWTVPQWYIWHDNVPAGESYYIFATCVNYDEPITNLPPPPTCHCPFSIPLQGYLGPGDDYHSKPWDIQTYISEDWCSWTVRCRDPEGEIIASDGHDKNWFTWAKEIYPTCNPETNIWSVMPEGGMQATNYSVLSAKCVVHQPESTTPKVTTTTTTPNTNICDCPYTLMDSSNAQELVGHRRDIYDNITLYETAKPTVNIINCGLSVGCPSGYERMVIGQDHWQTLGAGSYCNKDDKKWRMKPSTSEEHISSYAYVTCVWFKNPLARCDCQLSFIQQNNIKDEITQMPINFQDLIDRRLDYPSPTVTPTSGTGNCQLDFTCPSSWTKVLIAEGQGYKNGFTPLSCTNNQWQIQSAGFNTSSIKLSCVDYNRLTPTVPKSRCGCRYKSINSENAAFFVSHYDLYRDKVSKYEIYDAKPIGAQSTDSCIVYWECSSPGLRKVVFEQTRAYETVGPDTECYKYGETEYLWSIIPTDGYDNMSPYIFVTCVNYSAPITPEEPKCGGCAKSLLLENSFEGYTLTNWDVQVDINEETCSWNVHCRGDYRQATAEISSTERLLANSWTGICSQTDKKWTLTSNDNRTFDQLDQFRFNCVTETDKWD